MENHYIFQSTLPRGERRGRQLSSVEILRNFNPRSREGSDSKAAGLIFPTAISIHAPARGATSILSKIHPMFFNHFSQRFIFLLLPFPFFSSPSSQFQHLLCTFQVRISRAFSVYYRFAPKNQHLIYSCTTFYTDMFNFSFIIVSQIIKPKTVFFFIDNVC